MKTLCLALGFFCLFFASGCVIESNRPANSTPETTPSASSSAAPAATDTAAAPATTTNPVSSTPAPGVPPPMRAAPQQ